MERMGKAPGLDRRRGRQEALGGDLPPIEGLARSVVGVAAAEEVSVDPLQQEERGEVVGQLQVHHDAAGRLVAYRTHPVRPRLDAPPEELAGPGEVVHVRHARADEEVDTVGRLVRSRLTPRVDEDVTLAQRDEDGAADGGRLRQRRAGGQAPQHRRRRDGGGSPRRHVAVPGGVVLQVPPHHRRVDVVVVEAPGHRHRVGQGGHGAGLDVGARGQRGPVGDDGVGELRVAGHPGEGERWQARRRRRLRAQRAVAEHGDAVVAVVSALLHDGERAAHGLTDADGQRVGDGVEPVDQHARRQPVPHLALGGLTGRDHRREREALGIVERAVAHTQVVDGDEDPTTRRVPGGLGAPSGSREILGVVPAPVPRARLGEAHDRVGRRRASGDVTVRATCAGSPSPAASLTSRWRSTDRVGTCLPVSLPFAGVRGPAISARSVGRRPAGCTRR